MCESMRFKLQLHGNVVFMVTW